MSESVTAAAQRFLSAILWAEHLVVWEMLSPSGREYVLAAGERRGLDPVQAQRIRLGTSPVEERDDFLAGLVRGLRVDFSRVRLEDVKAGVGAERDDGAVEVPLECPSSFGSQGWAAGTLVFRRVDDHWKVDRIEPVGAGGG